MGNPNTKENISASHASTDHTVDRTVDHTVGDSAIDQDVITSTSHDTDADTLQELRSLLLGGSPDEILNSSLSSEALSKILPAAISNAHKNRAGMASATLPVVETAIQESIQQDASILAEALFPIIGPATRKSITAAIGALVQSLNQTLDYSLSPQSFKWRLEAKQTGKTFAEVVLIRTLIYQVEQVFLIHKETGLVIQHVVTETTTAQDPDLVSAMLTAIQDFVQDSFTTEDERSLDTLRLGDLTLLIEDGPQAVLACAVRGAVPVEIRELLRAQVERIHLIFGPNLQTFKGDQSLFEDCVPYLQDCFQAKFRGTKDTQPVKKRPPLSRSQKILGWCLAGALLSGIGLWSLMNWQSNRHWQQFVGTLQQQPGIVIIDQYKQRGTYHLNGLRDPLANDPQTLLRQATKINPDRVAMSWKPYLSLEPEFVESRTQALLSPPTGVSLSLSPQGVLTASGKASERWIQEAKNVSTSLEGITAWRDDNLISAEREALTTLKSRIEYRQFSFPSRKAALTERYDKTLENHAKDIIACIKAAQAIDTPISITIWGYGDQRGSAAQTIQLGKTRAHYLKRYLVDSGISPDFLEAKGVAISNGRHSGSRRASNPRARDDSSAAHFEVHF